MSASADTGNLARILQILLGAEIALALFIAWLCWLSLLPGKAMLVWALTPYVLIRAGILARGFQLAYKHRSPLSAQHRPSPLSWARVVVGEYVAVLMHYSGLLPFEQWLLPSAPQPAFSGKGVPVVLVHGFCSNRACWYFFARWLHKLGVGPIYAVSLEPLLGTIEDNATRLAPLIEQICETSKHPKVMLVGHDIGGLVGRALVHSSFGVKRLARVVTLGSPHHGSMVIEGIQQYGENLRQITLKSNWTERMSVFERAPSPVPITSLISPQDEVIAPQTSAVLRYPNAQNLVLKGIGHYEMLLSRKVVRMVAQVLQQV
ncbi:MAG: esterase/lipase family protein [Nevskiales bacterium]